MAEEFIDKNADSRGVHDYSDLQPEALLNLLKLSITQKCDPASTPREKDIARIEISHIIDLLTPDQLFSGEYKSSVMHSVVTHGDEDTFVAIANKPGVTAQHLLSGRPPEEMKESKIYKHAYDAGHRGILDLLKGKINSPEGKINGAQGVAILRGAQTIKPSPEPAASPAYKKPNGTTGEQANALLRLAQQQGHPDEVGGNPKGKGSPKR